MSFGSFNTCYALSVSSPPSYCVATNLATTNSTNIVLLTASVIGIQLDGSKHTLVKGSTKYVYHTFISDGTSSQTSYTFKLTETVTCSILVVAGGGAGGGCSYSTTCGGGGGGGGVIYIDKIFLKAGTYKILVGLGGYARASPHIPDTSGNHSSFISQSGSINYTSIGGGCGGDYKNGSSIYININGGSGGGGYTDTLNTYGYGSGTINQGNSGGIAYIDNTNSIYVGGGGGGSGGAPRDKNTYSSLNFNGIYIGQSQLGGIGVTNTINPTYTNAYGCGGNGGIYNSILYYGFGGGTSNQYTTIVNTTLTN
jgi:hypothetical protein